MAVVHMGRDRMEHLNAHLFLPVMAGRAFILTSKVQHRSTATRLCLKSCESHVIQSSLWTKSYEHQRAVSAHPELLIRSITWCSLFLLPLAWNFYYLHTITYYQRIPSFCSERSYITPILKPCRDHSTRYRPISLTRCVCKRVGCTVNCHLLWILKAEISFKFLVWVLML